MKSRHPKISEVRKMFRNRTEAGRLLGSALVSFKGENPIVLAIPSGGVPVGKEVASILGADLDVIVTRKIGAPGNPEFAIGSVTQNGQTISDMRLLEQMQISYDYLESEAEKQIESIRAALREYRGDRPYPNLEGRTVIIVDDGIATGSTIIAAIQSARKMKASKVIVAAPVGPHAEVAALSKSVDRIVCLMTPLNFYAVGDYYGDFSQIGPEEVKKLLEGTGPKGEDTK